MTIVSKTIHRGRARARMTSPRACPCTIHRQGRGDADYPAAREPWRCLRFWCVGCKAQRPWCSGASDYHPDLCADCAARAVAA